MNSLQNIVLQILKWIFSILSKYMGFLSEFLILFSVQSEGRLKNNATDFTDFTDLLNNPLLNHWSCYQRFDIGVQKLALGNILNQC
jgi:hypothetical protein